MGRNNPSQIPKEASGIALWRTEALKPVTAAPANSTTTKERLPIPP
jgi:hypothetical protein